MKDDSRRDREMQDKRLRKANLRLAWALGVVALLVMLWTMFNLRMHLQ